MGEKIKNETQSAEWLDSILTFIGAYIYSRIGTQILITIGTWIYRAVDSYILSML